MKHIYFLLGICFVAPCFAAMPDQSAPSVAFDFNVTGGEPLYQTSLPKAVYQHSHSGGLEDLIITNAEGEQVPYALLPYSFLHPQTVSSRNTKALVFFPVQENSLKSSDELRVQLEKNADKTTVSMSSSHAETDSRHIFVVDAGEKGQALKTLHVTWKGDDDKLIPLEILGSDDLKSWQMLGDTVLLKTSKGGSRLLQNTITLNYATGAHYLQIRTSEPTRVDAFALTEVIAEYNTVETSPGETIWQDLRLINREQDISAGRININYESPGYFPASKLTINLPQENTITGATIQIRNKTNEPWRYLTGASLYSIRQQGRTLTNPVLDIPVSVAHYWQIQFNLANGGIGKDNPTLAVGWQPHTLVWNARGSTPFTLHIGNSPDIVNKVEIAHLIPDFTIEKVRQVPQAQLTIKTNSGVVSDNAPNPWLSAPDYKRWLLWGGLVIGVLLLAGMAYSLLKTERKK
ncbi:MAG: DUF3999 domain-containing protein [Methyloglobulus sp.]|nr:DUF3999 domain-containing protein [Methyloglobulus sp.]